MLPTPAATATVEGLLRLVASRAALAEIGPDLAVTGGVPAALPRPGAAVERIGLPIGLSREGFAALERIAEPGVCAALVRAVEALRARALPASFVYAFDEAWAIGETVRERISAAVGRDYRLVEDIWAWHVTPGSGGWPPHRGIADARLERDMPEVLNVWVALSDVTTDRACMHAVPLDDDPGYPHALDQLGAPLESVRALPAAAGDALFWNANVLHWGGRCSARAVGPRVSCSFTLCRADAADRFPDLVLLSPLGDLDLASRMDAVARMILVYGAAQPDVTPLVREWAAVTHELASRFGRASGPSAPQRKAP